MNKTVIMFFAVIFSFLGSYLPVLFFKLNIFSGWSVFSGLVGGFIGIWIGAKVSQRFSE